MTSKVEIVDTGADAGYDHAPVYYQRYAILYTAIAIIASTALIVTVLTGQSLDPRENVTAALAVVWGLLGTGEATMFWTTYRKTQKAWDQHTQRWATQ